LTRKVVVAGRLRTDVLLLGHPEGIGDQITHRARPNGFDTTGFLGART
jgi:hypothetical protein